MPMQQLVDLELDVYHYALALLVKYTGDFKDLVNASHDYMASDINF